MGHTPTEEPERSCDIQLCFSILSFPFLLWQANASIAIKSNPLHLDRTAESLLHCLWHRHRVSRFPSQLSLSLPFSSSAATPNGPLIAICRGCCLPWATSERDPSRTTLPRRRYPPRVSTSRPVESPPTILILSSRSTTPAS
jgi:hypothetical protein